MVDFLSSSNAIAATKDKATVLSPGDLGGVPRLNPVALAVALTPDFFTEVRILLSDTEGRTGPPRCNLVSWVG